MQKTTTKKVAKRVTKKAVKPKIVGRFEVKKGRPGTGMGLYAHEPFKKGEFVIEYVGNKIPTKEADDLDSRYLFEIDEKWTIDGPTRINLAGYVNHSCEPNLEAEIEEGDDGEDHINYYTLRAIEPGEELTIDYGEEYYDEYLKPHGCKCAAKKHRG